LAQVWLWYCAGQLSDYQRHWYPHFAIGALLLAPIGLFAAVTLVRSGVHDLRRARFVARRLRHRTDWPDDLSYCATLPEVIALRLRDRSPLVRRAAAEVLFWESERRWTWARFGVHEALADPALRDDGPLPLAGVSLPEQALSDLMEWAGEGGAQSVRASVTLAAYYGHALSGAPDADLANDIRRKALDPNAPTVLRMELAQLLLEHRLFDCNH